MVDLLKTGDFQSWDASLDSDFWCTFVTAVTIRPQEDEHKTRASGSTGSWCTRKCPLSSWQLGDCGVSAEVEGGEACVKWGLALQRPVEFSGLDCLANRTFPLRASGQGTKHTLIHTHAHSHTHKRSDFEVNILLHYYPHCLGLDGPPW